MNKKSIAAIITILLLAGLTFVLYSNYFTGSSPRKEKIASKQSEEAITYTCPMHPSVVSDHPGACPICGMSLVKKSVQKESSTDDLATLKGISLSPTQRIMANISTTTVEKKTMEKEINAIGIVDMAEPLQTKISAHFRGRIEKLFVNYTGETVKQGQRLFELYSPDLVSAEQEFLSVLNVESEIGDAIYGEESQQRLISAAKDRLRLTFGLTETQIADIESTRTVNSTITYFSPISGTVLSKNVQEGEYVDEGSLLYNLADLSKVWAYLDVYEKDLRFFSINQTVHVTTESYPDEMFTGRITFIDPVINPESRTVRIRTEFSNPNGKLKPQMWVKAHVTMPGKEVLVIPSTAILSTGKRNIVWVEVSENSFEPREVQTGMQAGGFTEILENLNEGETIVVTGAYLLESESQLQTPATSGTHRHEENNQSDGNVPMGEMNMNNSESR